MAARAFSTLQGVKAGDCCLQTVAATCQGLGRSRACPAGVAIVRWLQRRSKYLRLYGGGNLLVYDNSLWYCDPLAQTWTRYLA